jgi:predicted DNA repair protein MutK
VRFTQRASAAAQKFGRALVEGMPVVLAVLSTVGIIAMLWVGGHILLVNLHESGWWHAPYEHVHDLEHDVAHAVGVLEGLVGWSVNTAISAVIGLVVGAVVVVVAHLLPFGGHDETSGTPAVTG